jgi:hypothetical protein
MSEVYISIILLLFCGYQFYMICKALKTGVIRLKIGPLGSGGIPTKLERKRNPFQFWIGILSATGFLTLCFWLSITVLVQ